MARNLISQSRTTRMVMSPGGSTAWLSLVVTLWSCTSTTSLPVDDQGLEVQLEGGVIDASDGILLGPVDGATYEQDADRTDAISVEEVLPSMSLCAGPVDGACPEDCFLLDGYRYDEKANCWRLVRPIACRKPGGGFTDLGACYLEIATNTLIVTPSPYFDGMLSTYRPCSDEQERIAHEVGYCPLP